MYLGVAKVKDFIQQLVDEDKVAFDALLAELPTKIVFEQSHYLHHAAMLVVGFAVAMGLLT